MIGLTNGTDVYSYAYDGFGNRYQQTANGVTTTYQLDLAVGLTQVLSDGTDSYLYGLGRIAQYDGAWTYFQTDALGSVRQLTDSAAIVTFSQSYEPYGSVLSSLGNDASNYAFTAEWGDASGMTYLRARYMNPSLGMFTSRDIWGGDFNNPLSLNRFIYVQGNPVNYTDPSGHFSNSSCTNIEAAESSLWNYTYAYDTGSEWYLRNIEPPCIEWEVMNNVRGTNIYEYFEDELGGGYWEIVQPGEFEAQYVKLYSPDDTDELHGLCGGYDVAAILGVENGTRFLAEIRSGDYLIYLIENGVVKVEHVDPDYTTSEELKVILNKHGYGVRIHEWVNYYDGIQLLKTTLFKQHYPIVGVGINGYGVVGDGLDEHWVVVEGISRYWERGEPWQWIKIYNPFRNYSEYIKGRDFMKSWIWDSHDIRATMVEVARPHAVSPATPQNPE